MKVPHPALACAAILAKPDPAFSTATPEVRQSSAIIPKISFLQTSIQSNSESTDPREI